MTVLIEPKLFRQHLVSPTDRGGKHQVFVDSAVAACNGRLALHRDRWDSRRREAELSEIYPQHGNLPAAHLPGRAEDRTVAAQDDGEISRDLERSSLY
jgi:hypothetical protein